MKFRKKPVVIEAIQYTEDNFKQVRDFIGKDCFDGMDVVIDTLEGRMRARKGDWIIRGVNGEFYPCKPDIFAKTYEPVLELL